MLSAAMVGAALDGSAATASALSELDVGSPAAQVNPAAFGRSASDGRPLASLFAFGSVALSSAPPDVTQRWLDRVVVTQVGDAARAGASVTVAATPRAGYVRAVRVGACSRCVILAGRFYRWNEGFKRHPLCQCTHIPARENIAGDLTTDPRAYFDSLTEAEQDRTFTRAGAQAIRDGADPAAVVNARRGMTTAQPKVVRTESREVFRFEMPGAEPFVIRDDVATEITSSRPRLIRDDSGLFTTEEGTLTRSGRSQMVLNRGEARLMPESLYEIAEDRSEAISLLMRHGYLR
ncbi:MAG: hypothetical protein Q4F67_11670 [Propionibacteriaceae bacterium]|nr:hypothetical protein [Propionibacteriaceae bacterium]